MFRYVEPGNARRNTCASSYSVTAALVNEMSAWCNPALIVVKSARTRRQSAAVEFQFVAPRLERPADFAVHPGLRQRNARLGRHLGDDRHVVFRPGHGLRSPLLQRAVGAARYEQSAAQGLDIGPVMPRE